MYPNDDNDVNDCDSLISEAYSDESCNIIFRVQPSTETINHSLCNTNNDSNSVSSVNLSRKKKGINIGFLKVQGICGKDMSKFSEINLMLLLQKTRIRMYLVCAKVNLKNINCLVHLR